MHVPHHLIVHVVDSVEGRLELRNLDLLEHHFCRCLDEGNHGLLMSDRDGFGKGRPLSGPWQPRVGPFVEQPMDTFSVPAEDCKHQWRVAHRIPSIHLIAIPDCQGNATAVESCAV